MATQGSVTQTQADAVQQEWFSVLRAFAPDDEVSVTERFPTAAELKQARDEVRERVTAAAPLVGRATVPELASVPSLSTGEAFRSTRAKVNEFTFRKMGREVPSMKESFFYAQRQVIEGRAGAGREGSEMSATSGMSVQSSFRGGSSAGGAGPRVREASGSPARLGSEARSQREVSAVREQQGAGPVVGHHSGDGAYRRQLEHAMGLQRKLQTGDLAAVKHSAARVGKFIRESGLSMTTFSHQQFQFDARRWRFKDQADADCVRRFLDRCIGLLKQRVKAGLSAGPSANVRPIIVVPSITHAVLNIHNAKTFLASGVWRDPTQCEGASDDQLLRINRPGCPFSEFILRSNPQKIAKEDWKFVCCVFVLGPAWQFKGFFGKQDIEPRDVLSQVAGFNVQYDDEELHPNILKWNVKSLRVSKTKNRRHKDIKTVEDFWRALNHHMAFQPSFRRFFQD